MAYGQQEPASEISRETITNEIERAVVRLRTIGEHAEEIGNHLYGTAPRAAEDASAKVSPSPNVTLSVRRLHDQLDRIEGAMARIEKGLR